MYERLEAIISGRVQGVMFRDFTQRRAKKLHLTGEVQNLSDGTVSVIAEGPREHLDKLLDQLRTGPLLSEVKNVEVEWYPISYDHKTFEINHD